jgi:hypothetical protein
MPKTYKKDDYLTATKYAQKIGEPVAIVKKAMHIADLKRATIIVHSARRPIVTPFGNSDKSVLHLRPEPEAYEILNKYIEEIKAKGESK